MKYDIFLQKESFSKQELLAYAWGRLLEDRPVEGCGQLPTPPMLMFDRVTLIEHKGKRGRIVAEQDISIDDWFFQCHFTEDPVQPGCLGVDAVWQLIGFYACVRGAKGVGRALGAKTIEFNGQIRPHNRQVTYDIEIKRYSEMKEQGVSMAIGSAKVSVDDDVIYEISDAKVGIFKGIQYKDYPFPSKQSVGGLIG